MIAKRQLTVNSKGMKRIINYCNKLSVILKSEIVCFNDNAISIHVKNLAYFALERSHFTAEMRCNGVLP